MERNHPKMRAALTGRGKQVPVDVVFDVCPEHGVESRAECEGWLYCLRMGCTWRSKFMIRKKLKRSGVRQG